MTPTDRRAARDRCDKATPGPWESPEQRAHRPAVWRRDEHGRWELLAEFLAPDWGIEDDAANAAFTRHARTDLPQALDELDRRDAVLADLQRLAEHGKWDELRRALRDEVERTTCE